MQEEFIKTLGQGSSGFVDLIKYTKPDGYSFLAAVKNSYAVNHQALQQEFKILNELSGNPRIVASLAENLEEGFDSNNGSKVYKLVLEYASTGSLSSFMDNYAHRILPDTLIRDFTRMILEGLESIHGLDYVHCDLKPANLLLFSCGNSYELKICDFGNSLKVGQVSSNWDEFCRFVGTSSYMSPESLDDGVATKALDMWSLGCLVLEMYTGMNPWPEMTVNDLESLLLARYAPEIPETVPCDAKEFIETCFARNPKERGSASQLLFHRFLRREEEKKSFMSKLKIFGSKLMICKTLAPKHFESD